MTLRNEYRADTHELLVICDSVRPPEADVLMDIGETVAALRTTLDHLVYALAVRHTGVEPPPHDRVISFPITDTDAAWTRFQPRLEDLSGEMRDALLPWQPFRHPGPLEDSRLRVLRELDDVYKHRRPVIVAGDWGHEVGIQGNEDLTLSGLKEPRALVAGDTFLTFVRASETTTVQVRCDFDAALAEPSIHSGMPPLVLSCMADDLVEIVGVIVDDLGGRFLVGSA